MCLAGLAVGLVRTAPATAAVPAGFTDSLVATVGAPTAIAFTPDGRMLITTQPGVLRVYANGALVATPALTIDPARICSNSERGLLGVAVDPQFASNHFVYLYYTFDKFSACPVGTPTATNNPVNRVSRFVLSDANLIDPASETVLLDNMTSPNGNHNAGDLAFGRDGFLYVTIGDGGSDYAGDSGGGGSNDASRDQNVLLGKVLRITASGGIPPTNPFQGADADRCNVAGRTSAGRKCRETFAWGLRNPFRMAFDPTATGTRFCINDVGQNDWEEIDLGQAGADYGWNCREGKHANPAAGASCTPAPAGMVDPIFDYAHGVSVPGTTSPTSCGSITGGAFVPSGGWPVTYGGSYLFSDYVCGWIFRRTPAGQVVDFATNLGGSSAVHLQFGPFGGAQALYYTTYAGGGEVRRIAYTGGSNRAPIAALTADKTAGPAPLAVTFDGSQSHDPDPGDTLTYLWDFGDGSPALETTSAVTAHTYTSVGSRTAVLRVRDPIGAVSDPAVLLIAVNDTPPVPVITSPAPTARFRVGQSITLDGAATDAEDGALPASALTWNVLLHHNTHTHPYLGPVSGTGITLTAPTPEDLAAAATSYLEIRLSARDSQGVETTISQALQPNRVTLALDTDPSGLSLTVNSTSLPTPLALVSWEGWSLSLAAPDQEDAGGRDYLFSSWSDGGARNHAFLTPASAAGATAGFTARPFVACANERGLVPDGRRQTLPLAGGATQWFVWDTRERRSYSVEVRAAAAGAPGTVLVARYSDGCGGTSTAATRDTRAIDPGAASFRASVGVEDTDDWYRLRFQPAAAGSYTISVGETTQFSPAWTTNGRYDTYYSVRNTTGATITARLRLARVDATAAGETTLVLPPRGVASTNTSSLGVVRGATGTARLTHDGPPGALLVEAAIASFATRPPYIQPVKFGPMRDTR